MSTLFPKSCQLESVEAGTMPHKSCLSIQIRCKKTPRVTFCLEFGHHTLLLPILDRTDREKILFWKRTIQLGSRKNARGNLIQWPHFTDGVLKVTQWCEVIWPAFTLTWGCESRETKTTRPLNSSIPHNGITLLKQKLFLDRGHPVECALSWIYSCHGFSLGSKKPTLPQTLPKQGWPHGLHQKPNTSSQDGQKYFDCPPTVFK